MLNNNDGERFRARYRNREPISSSMKVLEYPCKQGVSKMNHQFKNWKQSQSRRFEKRLLTLKVGKKVINPEDLKRFIKHKGLKKKIINPKGWKKI